MNNYHIHEIIGRGRQSKVYKARLKQSLEYVVVKACSKDLKPRVLQEVKVLNSLSHPNLLRFHTWYETQNHLWVILEYCVGGDLLALLRSDGQLPEASVLRLGRDLAAALLHLHSRGILHCDLKPSNVLLDENGRVRLGGLGISRRFEVVQRQLATLPNGLREMQQGSPFYLPPETIRTPGLYTTASDLWALGCVLYECAVGRPPFAASSTQQLNVLILSSQPALPAGISGELADLIIRLLEKDPARRCSWPELCSHAFWGASPPTLQPIPEEPVLAKLLYERDGSGGGGGGGGGAAAHHRASGTGSSFGGDADFAAAGVASGSLHESTHSAASSSGNGGTSSNASGEYLRGGAAASSAFGEPQQEQGPQQQQQHGAAADGSGGGGGSSGNGGSPGAVQGAAEAAAAAAHTAGGGAEDAYPGPTPAHPRHVSRTVGMLPSAEAIAAAAADGAAGIAAQFADMSPPGGGPQPGVVPGAAGAGATLVGPAAALEALVYHPTDSVMKPIVGNKRIERPLECVFNPSLLPFQPLPVAKVVAMPPHSKSGFVAVLARTISGAAHPHTKLATLVYCESLCANAGLVGEMLNGDMGPALARLLDMGGKDAALRLRAANLLGLLVRHAASISPALAAAGVCEGLAAAIRQLEDPQLQRRAAAALGELLFYADSQQRSAASGGHAGSGGGGETGLAWDLPPESVQRLAALLQPGQDEVAQHYAAKALENVFGLGGPWAHHLATGETTGRLMQLVDSKLPDVLRGTAASALCRLLRCQPGCLQSLVDHGGMDLLAAGLTDASPRVQQACVTVLSQLLCSRQLSASVSELCQCNDLFLEGLAGLLDNAAELLQAKGLIALGLLCRTPTGLACIVSWHGLLPQIERLCARERLQGVGGRPGGSSSGADQYMAAAVVGITQQIAANVVPLLGQAAAAARGAHAAHPSSASSALQPLQALLLLLGSVPFRPVVVSDGLISGLADMLAWEVSGGGGSSHSSAAAGGPAAALQQDLKAHLLDAIDAICSHPELLVEHYAIVLSHLLPALSAAVASQQETADTRFCCLKLLCDVVLQFVNEPRLYISTHASEHTTADSGIANKLIDAAVSQYVLPLMPALFADEDPMPLYALKLLGALLEFNRLWVVDVASAGLAGRFFEWLAIAHPHNNVHNMRLCRLVADARVVAPQVLAQLEAIDRVLAVLAYAHENDVEPFLEPALHLLTSLLNDVGPQETQKAVGALPLLLQLAAVSEADTALAAAHCLLKLVHLHPGDAAAVLAAPENAALLAPLLDPAGAAEQQGAGPGASCHADLAPLILLALATAAEARPALLQECGAALLVATGECLEVVRDPGLKRRWDSLLRGAGVAGARA